MSLKTRSYTDSGLHYELTLDGEDISDKVEDIPNIQKSIDFPRITEQRVGEMVVLLVDPEGYYVSTNSDNFFVAQGHHQSGIGIAVVLKIAFEGDTLETFFTGQLVKTEQVYRFNQRFTKLVFSDSMHKLFTTEITNFGLEKQFKLAEVSDAEKELNGVYELPPYVVPPSEGSVAVYKGLNDGLTEVSETAERGAVLRNQNFAVEGDVIKTEGGFILAPATGYPQVRLKSPYRNIGLKSAVEKILAHIGVTSKEIEIFSPEADRHFSTRGRIGYPTIAQSLFGSSNEADWSGFVSAWMYESGAYYILYTAQRGDQKNRSMLLSYNENTDTETLLYRFPDGATFVTEAWQLAKNGNDMAILCTDAGFQAYKNDIYFKDIIEPKTQGTYDASESGNTVYIIKRSLSLAHTDTTVIQLVHKNSPIKPMLSHHYQLGSSFSDLRSQDAGAAIHAQRTLEKYPDTTRKMLWHNNELYFVGVDSTSVGCAKVALSGGTPTWVDRVSLDGVSNASGFFIDIVDSTLQMTCNFMSQESSQDFSWSKAI